MDIFCFNAYIFRDNISIYAKCAGREETFQVDLAHLEEGVGGFWQKGPIIGLPIYHPFRLFGYLTTFGYILLVPVLYLAIYRFRKKHDEDVTGLIKNDFKNKAAVLIFAAHNG